MPRLEGNPKVMSNPIEATPAENPPKKPKHSNPLWDWMQYFVSLAIVGVTLGWLTIGSHGSHSGTDAETARAASPVPVRVAADASIEIDRGSPLGQKLEVVTIHSEEVRDPILQVTGSVLASRRPGSSEEGNFWQFNTIDLLDTYTAWEKARADIKFAESQLKRVRELSTAKEGALQREIERLEKLVKSGTETEKNLVEKRTDLMQTKILDGKDIYETETSIKTAKRQENALALQLQQAGLDSELLDNASPDMDVVAADVPEGRLNRIVVGQSCQARFYGLPDIKFPGKVSTLSAVLSSEHRTLRVLFLLSDPDDRLRPGMFAEIGLGMDPRNVLRIPAKSVIHVGHEDYVLVARNANEKSGPTNAGEGDKAPLVVTARRVVVHELINEMVEVDSGVSDHEQVLAENAILLKPQLVQSLRLSASTNASAAQGSHP